MADNMVVQLDSIEVNHSILFHRRIEDHPSIMFVGFAPDFGISFPLQTKTLQTSHWVSIFLPRRHWIFGTRWQADGLSWESLGPAHSGRATRECSEGNPIATQKDPYSIANKRVTTADFLKDTCWSLTWHVSVQWANYLLGSKSLFPFSVF